MIYDVLVNSDEEVIQYLVEAHNIAGLHALLKNQIPTGAKVTNVTQNPEVSKVTVIDEGGEMLVRVISRPNIPDWGDVSPYVSSSETQSFCIADSVSSVLDKLSKMDFKGVITEISEYTSGVTYLS